MRMNSFQPALGFVSGVLIGLSILMPVFGATSSSFDASTGVVTVGAAALLAIGFILHASRTARESSALRARMIGAHDRSA